MKRNLARQYDGNQQTAIWPEEVSNEGHVYVALGMSQQEVDAWTQRELHLAQQEASLSAVSARIAADHPK